MQVVNSEKRVFFLLYIAKNSFYIKVYFNLIRISFTNFSKFDLFLIRYPKNLNDRDSKTLIVYDNLYFKHSVRGKIMYMRQEIKF